MTCSYLARRRARTGRPWVATQPYKNNEPLLSLSLSLSLALALFFLVGFRGDPSGRMGSSLPTSSLLMKSWICVKSYDTKQYKKGLKAAAAILKKFPDHGDTLSMEGLTLNCMD
ncbi:putative transferase [Dioscorea sansibarensis]